MQNRNGTGASNLLSNGRDVEDRLSRYQPFLDPLAQCSPISGARADADFTDGDFAGSSWKVEPRSGRKGRRRTPREQVLLDLLDLVRRTTSDERKTL